MVIELYIGISIYLQWTYQTILLAEKRVNTYILHKNVSSEPFELFILGLIDIHKKLFVYHHSNIVKNDAQNSSLDS